MQAALLRPQLIRLFFRLLEFACSLMCCLRVCVCVCVGLSKTMLYRSFVVVCGLLRGIVVPLAVKWKVFIFAVPLKVVCEAFTMHLFRAEGGGGGGGVRVQHLYCCCAVCRTGCFFRGAVVWVKQSCHRLYNISGGHYLRCKSGESRG